MGRKKKTPEEAGLDADKIIEENSKAVKTDDEPPSDDMDVSSLSEDEVKDDGDDFDLSKLDKEVEDDVTEVDNQDFKHQYQVLQGKYNSELKRLSDELSRSLAANQQLMAELSKRNQAGPLEGDADEDLKDLKERFPNVYRGVMALLRNEASNLVRGTEAKVDNVANKVVAAERSRYFDAISKAIPRWESINKHPVFLKWLSQKDRYTGAQRGALLNYAYNNMDAETTIKFFSDFMNEKGIRNKAARESDDENVAPNTSGGNPPPRREGGTITRSEIKNFYNDKAKGKYSGSQDDAEKFERRIMTAIKEGKVLER